VQPSKLEAKVSACNRDKQNRRMLQSANYLL
jgi:hypothetical protein